MRQDASEIWSLLAHHRELAKEHRKNLEPLESGTVRVFDGPGTDHEITDKWIETYRKWIAGLEAIIAKYEDTDG